MYINVRSIRYDNKINTADGLIELFYSELSSCNGFINEWKSTFFSKAYPSLLSKADENLNLPKRI